MSPKYFLAQLEHNYVILVCCISLSITFCSVQVIISFGPHWENMSSKWPLGPPTGNTPNKPPQKSVRRRLGSPRKSLVFSNDVSKEVCNCFVLIFLKLIYMKNNSSY